MFDESGFTTDTVVRHEVKKELISYRRLEIQTYLVWIDFSCCGFSFYEHFIRQFVYAVFLYLKL